MRHTWRAQRPTNRVSTGHAVPAPTQGWDAVSPLADMPPQRAITLENFIPRPGYIEVRPGSALHAGDMGTSPVETLMCWNGPTASTLFAIAGGTIYDATLPGVGVATTVTGLVSSRAQYLNFTNSSNLHFLVVATGADPVHLWDGSAWSTPTLTGITSSDVAQVWAHKKRLWFVQNESTKVSYLPVEAISGAVTTFELGSLMTRGGYIVAMTTWTINTAQTIDDYAVFLTSRGQVIIYQGTDPDTANTWSIVGVYDIGPPIGRRCFCRIGGDVGIISIDGVMPLSQLPNTDRVAVDRISLTSIITNAMNEAATSFSTNFGWQLITWPRQTLALLNIPTAELTGAQQFAMNTLTGAWCKFVGLDAICWETMDDRMFFGAAGGEVVELGVGASDRGDVIRAEVHTAFNYFDSQGYQKIYTMIQPLLTSDGSVQPGLGLNVDFGQGATVTVPAVAVSAAAIWDLSLWDEAFWPLTALQSANWTTVTGIGQCASVVCRVSTNAVESVLLRVNGWHITLEQGEFL